MKPRGPSTSSKQAQAYLSKHPGVSAVDLAEKFGIHVTTVRRAPWWKNRAQPVKQEAQP